MDVNNVMFILKKYKIEIVLLALLVYIICFLLKKIPVCKKFSFYLPYVVGIIVYYAYLLIVKHPTEDVINNGITIGALSLILNSIISSCGKKDFKKELLYGLVAEDKRDKVCNQIFECIANNDKELVKKILSESVTFTLCEEQLNNLVEILFT